MDQTLVVQRLLKQAQPFVTVRPGTFDRETPISRLRVWSSTRPTVPTPAMFKPMFYGVLRGTKALIIGGQNFELTAGNCMASSFGLPYVGAFTDATPASPYVAFNLDLDVDLLIDVMLDMPKGEDRWVCSAAAGKLEGPLGEAFVRLASLIDAPDDRAVLGRSYEAELYYRLLQGPMGDTLRQLGQRDGRLRQIKTAADWLIANHHRPLDVSELAASVGMSMTSFYRHFRTVTGYSPLSFQRHMRLLEARRLLAGGGQSVSGVAYAVGYVSPSQFSREYKTTFGTPPVMDQASSARRMAG